MYIIELKVQNRDESSYWYFESVAFVTLFNKFYGVFNSLVVRLYAVLSNVKVTHFFHPPPEIKADGRGGKALILLWLLWTFRAWNETLKEEFHVVVRSLGWINEVMKLETGELIDNVKHLVQCRLSNVGLCSKCHNPFISFN